MNEDYCGWVPLNYVLPKILSRSEKQKLSESYKEFNETHKCERSKRKNQKVNVSDTQIIGLPAVKTGHARLIEGVWIPAYARKLVATELMGDYKGESGVVYTQRMEDDRCKKDICPESRVVFP